jgi:hypothetical protein
MGRGISFNALKIFLFTSGRVTTYPNIPQFKYTWTSHNLFIIPIESLLKQTGASVPLGTNGMLFLKVHAHSFLIYELLPSNGRSTIPYQRL